MYWKLLSIISAFLISSHASGGIEKIYEKEKGQYFIYFDYESMSDICHISVSTKNKDYDCFTDYNLEHTRCDSTERSENKKLGFDSALASTKKLISGSKFKDKRKIDICRKNGFGYIFGPYLISCTYTRISCDTCKNEKSFPSNSCIDSKDKEKIIERLRKVDF
jgi:hypothetical protein